MIPRRVPDRAPPPSAVPDDWFDGFGAADAAAAPADPPPERAVGGLDRLAATAAVLAALGATFAYLATTAHAEAVLGKNDAAIAKTEAANQWAYYQAKSVKEHLAELAAESLPTPARRDEWSAQAQRYRLEMAEIKATADRLESHAVRRERDAEVRLRRHQRWSQALAFVQIGTVVAVVALMARRRWLHTLAVALGAAGALIGAGAAFGV